MLKTCFSALITWSSNACIIRFAGRLDRILALAGELEGGRLRLAAFEMQHPLLGITALKQRTYAHYLRTALPEFIKLMGSSNFLGELCGTPSSVNAGLSPMMLLVAAFEFQSCQILSCACFC